MNKYWFYKVGLVVVFLCFALLGGAKVKLPTLVSDGMVLQRGEPVNIWGTADPDETVDITFLKKKYKTVADVQGNWKVTLPILKAGGPYTMAINDIELKDILIGDVWVCSGQSNMEMPVKGFRGQPVEGSCDAIATALLSDNIRMITLKINSSQTVLDDCVATPWVESTPANVADFSATAYFLQVICVSFECAGRCHLFQLGWSKIESWINKEVYTEKFPEISLSVLTKDPKDIARPKDEPTLLYNAMIHPIKQFTIKGTNLVSGRE